MSEKNKKPLRLLDLIHKQKTGTVIIIAREPELAALEFSHLDGLYALCYVRRPERHNGAITHLHIGTVIKPVEGEENTYELVEGGEGGVDSKHTD